MTQRDQIWAHLESGKTLTPIQALDKFGCLRLAARIHELRKQGKSIVDDGDGHHSVYRACVSH